MTPKTRLMLIIFLIITTYMTSMSVFVKFLPNSLSILGAFVGMGLLLSLLVNIILAKTVQSVCGQDEDEAQEPLSDSEIAKSYAALALSLFQKKGRLIDFLQEDIADYSDQQVGSAVRNIHQGCREVLQEHFTVEPVMTAQEGEEVKLEEGFDPCKIRITGNVDGQPPFIGVLRHPGWHIVSTQNLPSLPTNQSMTVIEPAEVEIQ